MQNSETSSILPNHCDFSHELHEDPSFASITVHDEVNDLVDGVLLLEHDVLTDFLVIVLIDVVIGLIMLII